MVKKFIFLLVTLFTSLVTGQNYDQFKIDTVPSVARSGPVDFDVIEITAPDGDAGPESNAIGDFNKDGINDIMFGNYWYEGPDFKNSHQFRLLSTRDLRTPDDFSVSLDANKDGYWDVVSGGHNFGLFYYENPGSNGGEWIRYTIDAERDNNGTADTNIVVAGLPHTLPWHSGGLVDVDGDGKNEEILSSASRTSDVSMRWYKYIDTGWVRFDLGDDCHQWGSGVGDINGDNKNDIICPDAWFEGDGIGGWTRHDFYSSILGSAETQEPEPRYTNSHGAVSAHATQIYIYDVDQDGLNDILINAAHGYGIYWYEQVMRNGRREFIEHGIDISWAGGHSLEFEDIDNDGDPDLITGKRWGVWQPDARGANVLYWYELKPGEANPWVRHALSYNEGIGQGTKGAVMDIDGDGDLDILANSAENAKAFLFINKLDPPEPVFDTRKVISLKNNSTQVGNGSVSFSKIENGIEIIRDAKGVLQSKKVIKSELHNKKVEANEEN